uniref:Uncharacterized protein n=1 Tax=Oryza sativa subsp. japonica TaxID=39947 RepID=Q6ET62_ORYSJ|nr:hypothetical protein [Oryza sativa Japonica Group]
MQPHPKSDMNRSSSYSAQSFPSFYEAAAERNNDAIDLRELLIGRLRGFRFGGISLFLATAQIRRGKKTWLTSRLPLLAAAPPSRFAGSSRWLVRRWRWVWRR